MSKYKIHYGSDGAVKGYGPNVDEYQPQLVAGDKIALSDDLPAPTTDDLFTNLREQRDARISTMFWMRERHNDELALGRATTLTSEQYTALLAYIQTLRDLPAQPGAPWDGGGDETPWPELPSV